MEGGDLRRLSAISDEGNFSCLKSVIPPNTAPGWTSITTGVNPGKHGIFYFFNFSTTPFTIVNATNSSTPRIWDYVQTINGRSILVNVPVTYPVREFSGKMVSGIPPWFIDEKSVYPANLVEKLRNSGYEIDAPLSRVLEKQPETLVTRLIETERKRVEAFLDLLKSEEHWSFGMIVITALDRLQHKLVGEGEREEKEVRRAYREVDELIGKIIDSLGNEVNFLCVSDHGFTPTPIAFYPNSWLRERGLLKTDSPYKYRLTKFLHDLLDGHFLWVPQGITKKFQGGRVVVRSIDTIDVESSGAFVPGTDGLIIVKSKSDLASITSGLSELKDDSGRKLCQVYPRDQIYSGNRLKDGPELLIIPREDVNIRPEPFSRKISEPSKKFARGNHSPYGIFFAAGPSIKKSPRLNLSLEDVTPTALTLMGIRPPDFMDGRSVDEIIVDSYSAELLQLPSIPTFEQTFEFSKAEEEFVMDNLKRIGYA